MTIEHVRLKTVLSYDPTTGSFTWLHQRGRQRAGCLAGYQRTDGRWVVRVDGAIYLRSRLAYFYMTGAWPVPEVDHINRNGSDDRWANLREASRLLNSLNVGVRSDNRTGFKGVGFSRYHNKFSARLLGKFLGYFATAEEAAAAYQAKAAEVLAGAA